MISETHCKFKYKINIWKWHVLLLELVSENCYKQINIDKLILCEIRGLHKESNNVEG